MSSKVEPFDLPKDHFAYPGIGLRVKAGEMLLKRETVGCYAGVVVADNEHLKQRFGWALGEGERVAVIDAEYQSNVIRFINDGVHNRKDGKPNCDASVMRIGEIDAILISTNSEIHELQELLLDYGEAYWDA